MIWMDSGMVPAGGAQDPQGQMVVVIEAEVRGMKVIIRHTITADERRTMATEEGMQHHMETAGDLPK